MKKCPVWDNSTMSNLNNRQKNNVSVSAISNVVFFHSKTFYTLTELSRKAVSS